VDPIRILHYLQNDGYSALVKALRAGEPQAVIAEIKEAGLRGRGGAGFPTGLKWELLAKQRDGRGKFLVCNAERATPAPTWTAACSRATRTRSRGMLIGAYATGASEGVIYVRNEYPLAIKHLVIALRQARELGCWARTSSAPASTSTSAWCAAREPSCAARRPR